MGIRDAAEVDRQQCVAGSPGGEEGVAFDEFGDSAVGGIIMINSGGQAVGAALDDELVRMQSEVQVAEDGWHPDGPITAVPMAADPRMGEVWIPTHEGKSGRSYWLSV